MARDAIIVLRDLLATLPRCAKCDEPATRAHADFEQRYCDKHNARALEMPHAEALREAKQLLDAELLEDRPLHERLAEPIDQPIPYVPCTPPPHNQEPSK